jgi:hypothetical protein
MGPPGGLGPPLLAPMFFAAILSNDIREGNPMGTAFDSVEEIIQHKNLSKFSLFDVEEYYNRLDDHATLYSIDGDKDARLQTFYNHLNRLLAGRSGYVTEVIGKYNTFKIMVGVREDSDTERNIEVLVQNSITSEIIGIMNLIKTMEKKTSEKTPGYRKMVDKSFRLALTIYDDNMETIRTTEFGLKFLNGLYSIIMTNRGLPDLNIV